MEGAALPRERCEGANSIHRGGFFGYSKNHPMDQPADTSLLVDCDEFADAQTKNILDRVRGGSQRMRGAFPPAAIAVICLLPLAAASPAEPTPVTLWNSGQEGHHTYRIPALAMTPKGTLLAFCEGHRESQKDSGSIHILLKRSRDGGATWSPPIQAMDFGRDTIGNPAPVVDRKTGTVWLLATGNNGGDTESAILARTAAGTRTVWASRSTDDGLTWSQPEDITSAVKQSSWTWYATGPGAGIQLRSGRLMLACDHHSEAADGWFSHVI